MTTAIDILQKYWGHTAFRPLQEEIIQSILSGKDTLALLPTGGGKSICFQVPGLLMGGMTLVISPLIALMKDQVQRLQQMEIPATYIHGGMEIREVDNCLQAAMDGEYAFLYVSPERLRSEMFQLRLPRMPVKLLAVDEAHCISQWGYDFRPAYLEVAAIREALPKVPIIALTASATHKVQEDIQEKLLMKTPVLFRKSFRRDNLRYFVIEEENIIERIKTICQRALGSGLIYVRTRKRSVQLAKILSEVGIRSEAYHGGLGSADRDRIQQAWIDGDTRVVVATNAFGMGIDKPDVRFVLHYNLPFDLESYYQEAGRGGRDGQTSLAIAFDNAIDLAEAHRWNEQRYPAWEELKRHYDLVCSYFRVPASGTVYQRHAFDIQMLARESKEALLPLYNSIRLLDREGLLRLLDEPDDYALIRIKANPRHVWQYKEAHPKEGQVLEQALRTLGGEVYNYDQRFLPGRWAELMEIPFPELKKHLETLLQQDMITYLPPRAEPEILFFEARRALNKQDLDWAKYVFLREQSDLRFVKILSYVKERELCRSLTIQHYFGEHDHQPCGRCDICIGRNKIQLSDDEFHHLRKAILSFVRQGSVSYRQVMVELGQGTPAQREKVLRYLLDKEVFQANALGELQIVDKKK